MGEIRFTYLNGPDIEALAMTDAEILAAVVTRVVPVIAVILAILAILETQAIAEILAAAAVPRTLVLEILKSRIQMVLMYVIRKIARVMIPA